jgi:putative MATE family efflux protein
MKPFKTLSGKTVIEISSIAWPMALNAVLLHSVTIIDLMLVASLGETSIAAYGIAGAITAFVIGIQFAIANGTQLVLSRAFGAGNVTKIGREVASGWVVNIAFSLFALLGLFFFVGPIVGLVTQNEAVAVHAISYVNIMLLLLFFSSVSQVIVVYFNACRKTRIPLYGFFLEIPINVFLSAILIFGLFGAPEMGLAGAAWGSVIAIFVRFIYMAYRFHQEVVQGFVKEFGVIKAINVKLHLDEVVPVVANFIVLLTGQLVFQGLFAQLSVSAYAAITLILPWIKILSLFVNSWAQSSTVIVSQFIGKQELSSIPDFVSQSKLVATLMSLVMVFGFFIFSQFIPYIYGNLSADTLRALAIIAPAYILIPLFRTNNMFCGNMIRAMGESYLIVRINIITQWLIAIPVCALLIYLDAPLVIIFGVILMDEILKYLPFKKTLKKKLATYSAT